MAMQKRQSSPCKIQAIFLIFVKLFICKAIASDDTKQRAPYDIRYDGDYIQNHSNGLVEPLLYIQ